MRFPFNERKAAQAAAFIVERHGGVFNYISLIKLLYLADRTALIESGVPITGDAMVSLPKGPILSNVKNCLNNALGCGKVWTKFVSTRDDENKVSLVTAEPSRDELCDYEIEVLARVYAEHGKKTPGQLITFCHGLPEWEDPHGSARPILLEKLLLCADVPEERIRVIEQYAALLTQATDTGGSGL